MSKIKKGSVVMLTGVRFAGMGCKVLLAHSTSEKTQVTFEARIPKGPTVWVTADDNMDAIIKQLESVVASVVGSIAWNGSDLVNSGGFALEWSKGKHGFIVSPIEEAEPEPEPEKPVVLKPTEG